MNARSFTDELAAGMGEVPAPRKPSLVAPGIYPGMPMADYLSIPALSTDPIRAMIEECPRAAWYCSHLNPEREQESADALDIGTVAHELLLEGSCDRLAVIDPADYPAKNGNIPAGWTNTGIRAARDEARAAGKCPVFKARHAEIVEMYYEAQRFIDSLQTSEPAIWRAFQSDGGQSEVVIVWHEGGIPCKLRVDRRSLDWAVAVDYKTSAGTVEPDAWGRSQIHGGQKYGIGGAWYRRGIRAATGVDTTYIWLPQEKAPPYLCSLVGDDPAGVALADEKVAASIAQWQQCMDSDRWPGYAPRVAYIDTPAWEVARWQERQGIDQTHGGYPYDYSQLVPRRETA